MLLLATLAAYTKHISFSLPVMLSWAEINPPYPRGSENICRGVLPHKHQHSSRLLKYDILTQTTVGNRKASDNKQSARCLHINMHACVHKDIITVGVNTTVGNIIFRQMSVLNLKGASQKHQMMFVSILFPSSWLRNKISTQSKTCPLCLG